MNIIVIWGFSWFLKLVSRLEWRYHIHLYFNLNRSKSQQQLPQDTLYCKVKTYNNTVSEEISLKLKAYWFSCSLLIYLKCLAVLREKHIHKTWPYTVLVNRPTTRFLIFLRSTDFWASNLLLSVVFWLVLKWTGCTFRRSPCSYGWHHNNLLQLGGWLDGWMDGLYLTT